jgi:hypothetical protein
VPFAQQWLSPVNPKFQFRSRGVHPNNVKTGARKLKAVTIKIESQTITTYTLEKFRTSSQAQMDHFKKATAMMSTHYPSVKGSLAHDIVYSLTICVIQR